MTKLFTAKTPNPIQIRRSNFIPGNMSGEGDCSHAFTVDLFNRDFRAMILYDFLGGKSYQECFVSLTKCVLGTDQMVQRISVWKTDGWKIGCLVVTEHPHKALSTSKDNCSCKTVKKLASLNCCWVFTQNTILTGTGMNVGKENQFHGFICGN